MTGTGEFDPWLFLMFTVAIMGGAGWLTGQAVAATWRAPRHAVAGCVALGLADRFLVFALFDGALLSLTAFLVDTAVITGIGLIAWRITRVRRMVAQYPWLYEPVGLFFWRERSG